MVHGSIFDDMSHIMSRLSPPPDARNRPDGEKPKQLIPWSWLRGRVATRMYEEDTVEDIEILRRPKDADVQEFR